MTNLSNATMRIGGNSIGVNGVAGRPIHDSPTVTSVSASNTKNSESNSTVTWTYGQGQGDAQHAFRVRAQNNDGSTVYYDSGYQYSTDTSFVVDTDEEGIPARAGADVYWQVDVRSDDYSSHEAISRYEAEGDSSAITYAWGDAACTVTTLEGVTISGGAITITGATGQTVAWSLATDTQQEYRVMVKEFATDNVLSDSGWVVSTATSYDIPYTFSSGSRYKLSVQLKNDYGIRSH
tara:strand:- start:232 stop:939 length:708 start_codon:yes stop_codon:yes gene_type:complete